RRADLIVELRPRGIQRLGHDHPVLEQLPQALQGLATGLAGSPQLLEEAAQASRETLKSLGQLFEDRVIVAETLDTPWTQFYDQVSAAMDKTYQLDDAVLGYLDTQLQKRLQQVRTQMLLLVAAL
ncbi:hypothetical protein QM291_30845, partial [Pseudomonas aeruginosa]|nr:hypothetical protein [Pseudomonas aeruginosa]